MILLDNMAEWILGLGTVIAAVITVGRRLATAGGVQSGGLIGDLRGLGMSDVKGWIKHVQLRISGPHINIFMLGLGGSGKTEFVRAYCNNRNADPTKKTRAAKVYEHKESVTESGEARPTEFKINIIDSVGQNAATAATVAKAFKAIHVMLLMVDVRSPPARQEEAVWANDTPDIDRIQEHVAAWSKVALALAYGIAQGPSLQFVALFINKVDLLSDQSPQMREQLLRSFAPIIRELELQVGGSHRVVPIIGSARAGDGMQQFRELVFAAVQEQRTLAA